MKLTYAPELIKHPIIYKLRHQCEAVTEIRRADVNKDKDWMVLEPEAKGEDIELGIDSVTGKGVRGDPAVGDIIED